MSRGPPESIPAQDPDGLPRLSDPPSSLSASRITAYSSAQSGQRRRCCSTGRRDSGMGRPASMRSRYIPTQSSHRSQSISSGHVASSARASSRYSSFPSDMSSPLREVPRRTPPRAWLEVEGRPCVLVRDPRRDQPRLEPLARGVAELVKRVAADPELARELLLGHPAPLADQRRPLAFGQFALERPPEQVEELAAFGLPRRSRRRGGRIGRGPPVLGRQPV